MRQRFSELFRRSLLNFILINLAFFSLLVSNSCSSSSHRRPTFSPALLLFMIHLLSSTLYSFLFSTIILCTYFILKIFLEYSIHSTRPPTQQQTRSSDNKDLWVVLTDELLLFVLLKSREFQLQLCRIHFVLCMDNLASFSQVFLRSMWWWFPLSLLNLRIFFCHSTLEEAK